MSCLRLKTDQWETQSFRSFRFQKAAKVKEGRYPVLPILIFDVILYELLLLCCRGRVFWLDSDGVLFPFWGEVNSEFPDLPLRGREFDFPRGHSSDT